MVTKTSPSERLRQWIDDHIVYTRKVPHTDIEVQLIKGGTMNKPEIGQIVHYMDAQKVVVPAMITKVDQPNGEIVLTVFDYVMTTPGIKASYRSISGPKDAEPGAWWFKDRL